MKKLPPSHQLHTYKPERRLSVPRLIFTFILLGGCIYGLVRGWSRWQQARMLSTKDPWFAAYVDVTSTPLYHFENLGDTPTPHVVLSFIVSSPQDPCIPTWGAAYTIDEAALSLDLDRRIARLRQLGGSLAISFGGAKNDELALKCTDANALYNAYLTVINRYQVDTIDLDLENHGLSDNDALKRRSQVIAKLQSDFRAQGKSLAVWLTLPVTPQGLSVDGTNAVSQMLENGVDLSGINVMTMDYGQSRLSGQSMAGASENALNETHRQLGIIYKQAGTDLLASTLWRKLGATPMIGQNDVVGEIFTLDDAKQFNQFAAQNGLGRVSMWSANRDISCGENYVDVQVVSDSCSGIKEEKLSFSTILSNKFSGSISQNASAVTTQEPQAAVQIIDDPQTSPYQIWKPTGAYLAGVKVVWHGNVYAAKWWTKNDVPDNPVLQSWQTPWQLIGPVLPGEKPVKLPTLPAGTYPNWNGTTEYQAGERVLFDNIPFEAKWWNQGESPAAAAANADSSPWSPLTQDQIQAILEQGK